MLELTRSPCAASAGAAATAAATAPTAAEGLGVQGNELRSAQDAVPLPRPGSPRRHVEIRPSLTQWLQQSILSLRKTIQVVRVYHGMKCPRINHLQQTSPPPLLWP